MSEKKRKRNRPVLLRLNESEMEMLHQKMQKAQIKNREAYLRKMALNGYIIVQDFEAIRDASHELGLIGEELKRMKKSDGAEGSENAETLREIEERLDAIWNFLEEALKKD